MEIARATAWIRMMKRSTTSRKASPQDLVLLLYLFCVEHSSKEDGFETRGRYTVVSWLIGISWRRIGEWQIEAASYFLDMSDASDLRVDDRSAIHLKWT